MTGHPRVLPDPDWAIGKHALMNLAIRLRNGRTEIDPSSWRIPYQWQGTHYQDNDDQPFLLLINSGGGFVEGDTAHLHATLDPGSRALITTTAASKFYKCPLGETSAEHINITVGAGALLEYCPDEAIPFAGSRVLRRTQIDIAEDSYLFATDMISAGRIHYGRSGEAFDFHTLDSEFVVNLDGAPLVIDRQVATQPDEVAALARMWDGARHQATVIIWGDLPEGIEDQIEQTLYGIEGVKAGASRQGRLVSCRILAGETWMCHEAIHEVWKHVRPALAGKPARLIRKC